MFVIEQAEATRMTISREDFDNLPSYFQIIKVDYKNSVALLKLNGITYKAIIQ